MPRSETAAAEAILLLAVLAAPWPYGSAGDTYRYGLAALLLLAGAVWLLGLSRARAGLPALALPASGLALVPGAQLLLGASVAPTWTLDAGLSLLGMLATLVFWSERARDGAAARRLVAALLATCLLQAAFGVVQASVSPGRLYGKAAPAVTMPYGSYVTHNHFAGLMEMGALLALGAGLGAAARSRAATPGGVGLMGACLALAAAVVASRSRAGLLALSAGAVVAFAAASSLRKPRRPRAGALAAAGLGALALVGFGLAAGSPAARARFATLVSGGADSSASYRLAIAKATLRLAATRPLLGSGLGAYSDAVPPFKTSHGEVRTTHAESDALELLAETGLLGPAAAAWLGLAIWRGLRARIVHGRDPFRKGVAVGGAAGASALLVHGLLDFNLHLPSNALAFVCLLGLAAASPLPPPARGGRRAAALAALVLLGGCAAAAWSAHADWALRRAQREPDPTARAEQLSAVAAWHPRMPAARHALGVALRELAGSGAVLRGRRLQGAEAEFAAAVRLRPSWGEAWADLGWVRALRGDVAGARADLDRAAALDPTHEAIRIARERLLSAYGVAR